MVSRALNPFRMSWAGLYAGPGAWAVSTQTNYALVPWVCAHKINLIPVLALVLAAIALGGAFLSWRSWHSPLVEGTEIGAGIPEAPRPFLGALGALLGILFALVILTQGAAGLVLNGCER
jgi:hypothetical protein